MGSLSGSTITGTLGHQTIGRGTNVFNGVSSTISSSGQTTVPITLSR
jgi:hypothetical protein